MNWDELISSIPTLQPVDKFLVLIIYLPSTSTSMERNVCFENSQFLIESHIDGNRAWCITWKYSTILFFILILMWVLQKRSFIQLISYAFSAFYFHVLVPTSLMLYISFSAGSMLVSTSGLGRRVGFTIISISIVIGQVVLTYFSLICQPLTDYSNFHPLNWNWTRDFHHATHLRNSHVFRPRCSHWQIGLSSML